MVDVSNVPKVTGGNGMSGASGSSGGRGGSGSSANGSASDRGSTVGASHPVASAPADRLPYTAMLWTVAVLSFAAVAFAVWAQHRFDWRPCPWCILQRVLFVAIGLLAMVAALWRSRTAVKALSAVGILFAVAGVASALWQHFVAAKSSSCMTTFADTVVTTLGLDKALPSVFQVTGSCAEAAVSMLGVPFEFWSLGLFVVLGAALAAAGRTRIR